MPVPQAKAPMPPSIHSQRVFSRLLHVCLKIDVCPSSQCLIISRWGSFKSRLDILLSRAVGWLLQVWKTFKSSFSDHYSLWVWRCKPYWFSELVFGGLISQAYVLKFGGSRVGFEPFAPQGVTLCFEFPLSCGTPCWSWGLWWDYVPASFTQFNVVFFSFANVSSSLSQPLGFLKWKLFHM